MRKSKTLQGNRQQYFCQHLSTKYLLTSIAVLYYIYKIILVCNNIFIQSEVQFPNLCKILQYLICFWQIMKIYEHFQMKLVCFVLYYLCKSLKKIVLSCLCAYQVQVGISKTSIWFISLKLPFFCFSNFLSYKKFFVQKNSTKLTSAKKLPHTTNSVKDLQLRKWLLTILSYHETI